MAKLKNLLLEASGVAGLDDDVALIEALGGLAANWVKLAGELDDFDSALALARAIAEGAKSDEVAAAFKKAKAEEVLEVLQAQAGNLQALLDRIPDTVVRLLQPVGAFDERQGAADRGLIAWPIVNKTLNPLPGDEAGDGPAYSLSLGMQAALSIEAGDTWPYSDPMPEALLRVKASGGLKPSGSAGIPFSAGRVDVSASASAACALEYYFAVADPQAIYALALAERLVGLPDPFDFDSVWAAFRTTDLAGLHYRFEGSGELKVAVSMADAAALGKWADAQLGASVTVGVSLAGTYNLTFRAGPRGADGARTVIATLSRHRSESASLGARIGVTIDAARLASKVHDLLADALERSDDVLAEIKPLLSPGTWLQKQGGDLIAKGAGSLIADAELRDALVRDLQGALGIGEIEDPALAEWLAAELATSIDSATAWTEDKARATQSVLDRLGRSLPAFAQPAIRDRLQTTADELIGSASDELKKRVKKALADNGKALGAELHRLGAISGKSVSTLDEAMAGVRALVKRYEDLFQKLLAETQKAVRSKISAAIMAEESRTRSATTEIEGTFLAQSDGARAAFEALTRGELDALVRLIESGGEGSDFAVDPGKSSLKRYAGSTSKLGIELVLFGFGLTGGELLKADAEVIVDGTGKVQVASKATLTREFGGLDAERRIELVNSFSLVQARALAGMSPTIDRGLGLAITVGHLDRGLQRHEVERFVGSLVEASLIAPGADTLAADTFTRWAGNPGSDGKIAASLMLKLSLKRTDLAKMLGLDVSPTESVLPDAHGRRIVQAAITNLIDSRAVDAGLFEASLAVLRSRYPDASREDLLVDRRRIKRALEVRASGQMTRSMPAEHQPFATAVDLALGMREMIERLRKIYFSEPELHPDTDKATWSAEDYRDEERAATGAVRGWLQLNDRLFWTNSKVHRRTLAFLHTLSELADIEPEAFTLTMTRTDEDATPETVVLTGLAEADQEALLHG